MKMSPAEILGYLGFDIPDEGITINPHDAYLTVSTLRLVGELMDVDQIPHSKLVELNSALKGLFAAKLGQAPSTSTMPSEALSETGGQMLRGYMRGLLRVDFGRKA